MTSSSSQQVMQRVKVGMIGLSAVILLIGLASAVFSAANRERSAEAPKPQVVNNVTLANAAAPVGPATEPLAELGVAPGGAETNSTEPRR